jgi:hypothetical protein
MLDPDLVLAALVTAVKSISTVTAAVAGSANIITHQYAYSADHSLARAVRQLPSPSILIAYQDLLGGQWDASTVWKHRFELWLRPKNMASGSSPPGCTPMHLWWLLMHSPVTSISPGTLDIRTVRLLPGLAPVDAMPQLVRMQDEEGADIFCGRIAIPELGDD